jgi:hypothetical protein
LLLSSLFALSAMAVSNHSKPSSTPDSKKSDSQSQQQAGEVEDNSDQQQTDIEKRQEPDNSGWNNPLEKPGSVGVSDSRGGFSPSHNP